MVAAVGAFFQELVQVGIYKRSQGRVTRQVTFAALAVVVTLGMWRLHIVMNTWRVVNTMPGIQYWMPGLLLLALFWVAYRVVNLPAFADFLIAVEAEMNKVSWPTRTELFRASMVVLFTIFFLAIVLATFDFGWRILFTKVLRIF